MPHFVAYIRKSALRKAGMKEDRIYSPRDLWNSTLDESDYHVFTHSQLPEGGVKEYEKNPEYIRRDFYGGN